MRKFIYGSTKQVDEDLKKLRRGLEELCAQFDAESTWPDWWPEKLGQSEFDALSQSVGLCVPSFRPVFRKQKRSEEDRTADMVLGIPYTSRVHCWPRDWPLAGKGRQRLWADGPFKESAVAEPLLPYLQVDLAGLSQLSGRNVGTGVLQVWQNPRVYELLLRIIPRRHFMTSKLAPVADDEQERLDEWISEYSFDDCSPNYSGGVIKEWRNQGIFTRPIFHEIFWDEHSWLAMLAKRSVINCAGSADRLYRSSKRYWELEVPSPASNVRAFGFADTVNRDYLEATGDRWRLLLELKDDGLPWNWAWGCGLVYFRKVTLGGKPLPKRMSNVVRSGGYEFVCTYQKG
jgi:hypothetical protein